LKELKRLDDAYLTAEANFIQDKINTVAALLEKTKYGILNFVFSLKPIVGNRDAKLEFTQTKNFFKKSLAVNKDLITLV